MKPYLAVTKALADSNRSRTLLFLRQGELCVCQIVELLGLAPSTVSKHLTILHQAGLVESRRDGRWIYYRLPDAPEAYIQEALSWVCRTLGDESRIITDNGRLAAVLAVSRDELCSRYKSCCGAPSVPARRKAKPC